MSDITWNAADAAEASNFAENEDQRVLTWSAVNQFIEEFVSEYEYTDGDGGYYTPNPQEAMLIEDAINGMMANHDFLDRIHAAVEARRTKP